MLDTGNPKPALCDDIEGWNGVQDGGEFKREGAYDTYGQFMLIYGKTTIL